MQDELKRNGKKSIWCHIQKETIIEKSCFAINAWRRGSSHLGGTKANHSRLSERTADKNGLCITGKEVKGCEVWRPGPYLYGGLGEEGRAPEIPVGGAGIRLDSKS